MHKAVWSRVRSTGLVFSLGSGLQGLKRSLLLRCEWPGRGLVHDPEEMATEWKRVARSRSFNAPCHQLEANLSNVGPALVGRPCRVRGSISPGSHAGESHRACAAAD